MKYDGEWLASDISLRNFRLVQFGAVAILIAMGTLHYVFREFLEPGTLQRATRFFDVGKEESIPTAFSILNLFVSSLLLYAAYIVSKFRCEKISTYWLILSFIFLYLSIDEAASIHERLGGVTNYIGFVSIEFAHNRWIFLGAIFTTVVFLGFLPFLLALPRRTAALIMLSGGIFVCGALGFETLGGVMLNSGFVSDRSDFIYQIRRVFEESFEMVGIALFNCTLFAHLIPATVGIRFTHRNE